MALDHAALLEVLESMKAAGVDDRVRTAAETIYQALIDAQLTAVIGAGPWERSPDRTTQRNGYRPRMLSTTAGDLELRIPKLRERSFCPSLLNAAPEGSQSRAGTGGDVTRSPMQLTAPTRVRQRHASEPPACHRSMCWACVGR